MDKKRIGLVTNWYPTEDNPYQGSFFKEQAFALADHFDFIVIHYWEKFRIPDPVYWLRSRKGKHFSLKKTNVEGNTVEYTVHGQIPLSVFLKYYWEKITARFRSGQTAPAALHQSAPYLKHRQKLLADIFKRFPETPDLLYCVSAQTESCLLQQIASVINTPYVLSEHGPFPWPGTTIRSTEKAPIENADAFLAISYDKIRQVLLQDIHPKKFVYVGNMVDETQFPLGNGSGREKTFVMVAAHTFYKNYPLFIRIFDRLKQITDIPFRVMVVGYNANKGYSRNAEALEQKLRDSSFADCLELIPAVSRDRIHEVYGKADAFVMTSIQEGMPVSALEAGCCGLPIFSTMCGGVEDYVDDSIGRIFKIVDSESFAQGLKAFLEGKLTFDRQHIRQQIVDRYGQKAFTENMAAIFNEVMDSHKN